MTGGGGLAETISLASHVPYEKKGPWLVKLGDAAVHIGSIHSVNASRAKLSQTVLPR